MEAITRLAFDTILASTKQSRTDTEMAVTRTRSVP